MYLFVIAIAIVIALKEKSFAIFNQISNCHCSRVKSEECDRGVESAPAFTKNIRTSIIIVLTNSFRPFVSRPPFAYEK